VTVKPSNTVQAHLLMFLFEFKMLSIIRGRTKTIDKLKKSCIYMGLRKFKDTVRY